MRSLVNLFISVPLFLFSLSCKGQIKNAKTLTVRVDGNCGMCEKTIESAGSQKKVASIDWNKDTKEATLTFDTNKTNKDEVLKRIALAGYDNENFLAPDEAYASLPSCCKYERSRKKSTVMNQKESSSENMENVKEQTKSNQLKSVFDSYFDLKNALVKSDYKQAGDKAADLKEKLQKIDMNKLDHAQHEVWMKIYTDLIAKAELIAKARNIENQRIQFMDLSATLYTLLKVAKPDAPIYYQHCPMYNDGKGANWLSREATIKNPYYGSQMLNCGKTVETVK
jgi:copper chaperone CopZ